MLLQLFAVEVVFYGGVRDFVSTGWLKKTVILLPAQPTVSDLQM